MERFISKTVSTLCNDYATDLRVRQERDKTLSLADLFVRAKNGFRKRENR